MQERNKSVSLSESILHAKTDDVAAVHELDIGQKFMLWSMELQSLTWSCS